MGRRHHCHVRRNLCGGARKRIGIDDLPRAIREDGRVGSTGTVLRGRRRFSGPTRLIGAKNRFPPPWSIDETDPELDRRCFIVLVRDIARNTRSLHRDFDRLAEILILAVQPLPVDTGPSHGPLWVESGVDALPRQGLLRAQAGHPGAFGSSSEEDIAELWTLLTSKWEPVPSFAPVRTARSCQQRK